MDAHLGVGTSQPPFAIHYTSKQKWGKLTFVDGKSVWIGYSIF